MSEVTVERMLKSHDVLAEFDFEIVELDKGYSNRTLRIDLDKNEINPIIGGRYVDKKWGDNVIKVLAVSKDGTEIKYIHEVLDGRNNPNPNVYKIGKQLLELYELIPEENGISTDSKASDGE